MPYEDDYGLDDDWIDPADSDDNLEASSQRRSMGGVDDWIVPPGAPAQSRTQAKASAIDDWIVPLDNNVPLPQPRPSPSGTITDMLMPQPRPAEADLRDVPLPRSRPADALSADPMVPPAPEPAAELHPDIPLDDPSQPYTKLRPLRRKPQPDVPEEMGQFGKGLAGAVTGTNPKLLGDAAEGLGILFGTEYFEDNKLSKLGKDQSEHYKARVPSYRNIRTDGVGNFISDFGDYAKYHTGAAIGTSLPSAVIGGGAAALTRNPMLGLVVGAAGPSYIQNYGDVYGSSKEDKDIAARLTSGELTKRQLAGITAAAAIPMAALDVAGLQTALGPLFAEAKGELMKRIVKGMAIGAIGEGGTEGLQEIVSQWAQHYLGSQTPLRQKFDSVVDNMLGGIFGGGAMGGGSVLAKTAVQGQPQPAGLDGDVIPPGPPPAAGPGLPAPQPTVIDGEVVPPSAPQTPETAQTAPIDTENEGTLGENTPNQASAIERRVLRKKGYSESQINDMGREEIAAELGEAAEQGIVPEPEEPASTKSPEAEPILSMPPETPVEAAVAPPEPPIIPPTGIEPAVRDVIPPEADAKSPALNETNETLDFTDLIPEGKAAKPLPPMMENYKHVIEEVPISWLEKLPGNGLRYNIDKLAKEISEEGLQDPLTILVGRKSKTAMLGEGNHRLAALKKLGHTTAPVRVWVGKEYGSSKPQPEWLTKDLIDVPEDFSKDAKPSEVFRSLQGKPADTATDATAAVDAALTEAGIDQSKIDPADIVTEAADKPKETQSSRPTTFYRGTNPGDPRRIKTGNESWDSYLFASSKRDDAAAYGNTVRQIDALPDAKILYEGTAEWRKIAGAPRKNENMLDYSARAAAAAKAAGYDAAHFQRQGDLGTAIFNRDKFRDPNPEFDPAPDAAAAVDAALTEAGIDQSKIDPADIEAVAKVVAETGADPADAFVQVMAEQIEEQTNADTGAVSESVEGQPQGGQSEEGQQLPGSDEAVQDQAGEGGEAGSPSAVDLSDQADQAAESGQAEVAQPKGEWRTEKQILYPDRQDFALYGKGGAFAKVTEDVATGEWGWSVSTKDKTAAPVSGRADTKEEAQVAAESEMLPPQAPEAGPSDSETIETLKDKLVIFASGMSRIKDLETGTHTWGGYKSRGIGVDVGELSKPAVAALARAAVDWKAQVFIDSGAFSMFRRKLRDLASVEAELGDLFGDKTRAPKRMDAMDFDKVLAKYDEVTDAISKRNEAEEQVPAPMVVMPDIVGDQAASLELVKRYKKQISTDANFNTVRPIVPIQKGALTLAQAYAEIVETLGTDRFIVGIPSNEKAVTNAELEAFLKEAKPKRIHFLGSASDKNLAPKLEAIVNAGIVLEHLSADANILRSALYGKPVEGTRSEAIQKTLQKRGEPETTRLIEGPAKAAIDNIEQAAKNAAGKRTASLYGKKKDAAYKTALAEEMAKRQPEIDRIKRKAASSAKMPPAPRKAKPKKDRGPTSLLEFIGMMGGFKPTPELRDKGLTYKSRVLIPGVGFRALVSKKRGLTMDRVVENLREGGYIGWEESSDISIHNQVLDLIDEELRGRKSYPMGEAAPETGLVEEQNAEHEANIADHEATVAQAIKDAGLTAEPHHVRRAAELMEEQGLEALDAVEAAVMESGIEEDVATAAEPEYSDLEDAFDALDLQTAADTSETVSPEGSESEPGGQAESAGFGEDDDGLGERAGQEPGPATTEQTEAGEQGVIPGAERISQGKLAQRKADEKLKPRVAQQAADDGLFGDGHKQTDLLDAINETPAPKPDLRSAFDDALDEFAPKTNERPTASWVIKDKATGEVAMETFDRKKVDALNTAKYEAVPIQEHLASLNKPQFDPATHVQIAADDLASLRSQDVERLFQEAPHTADAFDDLRVHILEGRPDLMTAVVNAIDEVGMPARPMGESAEAKASRQAENKAKAQRIYDHVVSGGTVSLPSNEGAKVHRHASNLKVGKDGLYVRRGKNWDFVPSLDAILPQVQTAGQAGVSAIKNVGLGLTDVAKGLDALFSPKNKLGSGPSFDEETYAKAKPMFRAGVAHFAQAGRDIAQMVRELVRYLIQTAKLARETVESMWPYIERFTKDVQSGKEKLDAPSVSSDLESDSGDTAADNGLGAADVSAPGGRPSIGSRTGGDPAVARGGRAGRSGVPQDHAPVVGEDGHLELPERQPEPESSTPGSDGRERGGADSGDGLHADRVPEEKAIRPAQAAPSLTERREAQQAAEKIAVEPGIDNIRATLPMLFPEQQDDVLKAETRFAKPDGHGMLFTNGTGTGKTFSGLGVIKRFVKQGKDNVLVVAPSQGILLDWQRAAKSLGIDAYILESLQDKGSGVTITTYANLGENKTLVERDWDLVVADESHKLSSAGTGEATDALRTFRALTLHPGGMADRARMVFKKEWAALDAIPAADMAARNKAYLAYDALAKPAMAGWEKLDRPKALMMSATPFSYHFSLDYAEGYLFDYGPENDSGGYNAPSARSAFYIQNFGYRMKTGKLNKPDVDVNSDIMERQFHEKLKREGALSGRALEVDKDYDRKFIVVDDAIGNQIDATLEFLSSADDGKFRPLYDVVQKKFDYLSRMRLLEAIKARHAVDYIKKSHKLGRKVVVFHDYNEGGGFSPFSMKFSPDEKVSVYQGGKAVSYNAIELYAEFLARNPGVDKLDFSGFRAPIAELTHHFPDALVYNGTISKKKRDEAKTLFNDDKSGRDLIIIQSAAGEFGISLHDITNVHQRTLLNLGMPIRPTSAIQQEGRIYRVGQASDALFRYMNTGTNWERWTFAGKIAERSGTAENFALGDQARTIRMSFVDAFNDADTNDPTEGEGTGGKEIDRANNITYTEFQKAKTFYFAQGKTRGRRDQREGVDYYATPEPVGLKMVEFANVKSGEKILEPSAGHGAISRHFPQDVSRTLVEPSSSLASRAALTSPGARVVQDRFENLNIVNKFHAIVMNPPFGHGGATAMQHVAKAAKHLVNGGRIVALIPRGGNADKAFDKFMEGDDAKGLYSVANYNLPPVTFERAGTSISSRIVVLEKQTDKENLSKLRDVARDYSNIETIGELFDRIEDSSIPQRIEPLTKEVVVEEGQTAKVTVGGVEFELSGSGEQTYAKVAVRVGPNKFTELTRASHANGGYYYTSLRSFRFNSAESRQKFLEQVANPPAPPPNMPVAGVSFKTGETIHALNGQKLFVATIENRVERSTYDEVNAAAKRHGGYYSAYSKRGAIPGFQFKSADARQAFLSEIQGKPAGDEKASVQGKAKGRSADAQDAIDRYKLTRQAEAQRREMVDAVRRAIEQVAGRSVATRAIVSDSVDLATPKEWGAAAREGTQAIGSYSPSLDLIRVALDEDAISTAYHEGWHAIEKTLLPEELGILNRELEGLRHYAARNRPDLRRVIGGVEASEIFAEAAAIYTQNRAKGDTGGIHVAIRRIFEKIARILAAISNAIQGLGFRTSGDIFEAFSQGEMAERRKGWKPSQGTEQASIRGRDLVNIKDTRSTSALEYAADRMVRLKNVARSMAENNPGMMIPDTYRTESLSYGRLNERLETLWRERVMPLQRAMRRSSIAPRALSEYIYALDAEKRNALIDERRQGSPEFLGSGSGMSNEQASDILHHVYDTGKIAEYDKLTAMVRAVLAADLDLRVSSGLLSGGQADSWREMFGETYVPWRGFEGDEDSQSPMNTGRRQGPRGRESQSALGRSTKADNAIVNSINKAVEGLIRSEENRVRRSLLLLAQADLASDEPTGMFTIIDTMQFKEVLDPKTNTVVTVQDRSWKNDPNLSIAKIGGKEHVVRINDDNLAKAFNDLLIYEPDAGLSLLQSVTRVYSWLRTVGNPAFPPKNFVRDNQDALIYATAHIKNGAALYAKHLPKALRASGRYVWTGKESPAFRRFRLSGGKVTYAQVRGLDQIRSKFSRAFTMHPRNFLDLIKEPLEAWSDMYESGVRFALFQAALESGLSQDEASSIALEGTLNFYRRGASELIAALTATQPFLNAGIQAPVRAGRLFKDSKSARAIYLGLIPLGFAIAAINYMIGGDDEDDDTPWYDKVPLFERERNFIFYTGQLDKNGKPEAVKLPAFPEVMFPTMLGASIAAAVFGKRPIAEIAGDVAKSAYAINPLAGRNVAPPFLSGAYAIWANKDFKDDPIHTPETRATKGVPASELKFGSTAQAWQDMARLLGKAGGGNRIEKPVGMLNLYPEDVRHIAKEIAGGWYSLIDYASSMVGKPSHQRTPILKDFVLPGDSHDRYEKEKFDKAAGRAAAKELLLKDQFDDKNASVRERQANRKANAGKIRSEGGIVGKRGGLKTVESDIYNTGREELAMLFQQLRVNEAQPTPDPAVTEKLRSKITSTRKEYRLLAEEVASGKTPYNAVAAVLTVRRKNMERNPAALDKYPLRPSAQGIKDLRAQENEIRLDQSLSRSERKDKIGALREQMRGLMRDARPSAN